MYKTDIVAIDIAKDKIYRSFAPIIIGEGDTYGDRFGVEVYNDGAAYSLSDMTCVGYFIRSTGDTVTLSGGSASGITGNVAWVTLPQTCYAKEGSFTLAIKVTGNGATTTLRIVDGVVARTTTDSIVDPGNTIPSLSDLLAQIDAMEAATAAAQAVTADVFEVTKNLWVNPSYSGTDNVTLTHNEDGSIHVSGTPGSTIFINTTCDQTLSLNAYTFSMIRDGTASGNVSAVLRNSDNTAPKFLTLGTNDYSGSMTVAYEPYTCEIVLYAGVAYDCDLYIQLELGVERTEWIRHKTAHDAVARNMTDMLYLRNVMMRVASNYKTIYKMDNYTEVTRWGNSAGSFVHNDNVVHYSIASAYPGGFFAGSFNSSDLVLQNVRVDFDLTIASGDIRLWLYGTDKTGIENAFTPTTLSAGHNSIDIDFAYYDVYTTLDISEPIFFLFTNTGSQVADFTVTDFRLRSLVTAQDYVPAYSDVFLYQALDNIVGKIPAQNSNVYLTSPDGNKWLLNVSNAGALSAVNLIPNKAAFIGNSLLAGWGSFGMAATDNEHDYYYYVTQKILEINSSATFSRLSNGNLEHSTEATDFETAWEEVRASLDADTDLICIQLGDNVNTADKVAQFEGSGGSFETMVTWIRTNCPNARLVWIGTWYNTIYDWLKTACAENNIQFIDILPLATSSNKSRLGTVIHRTEEHTQTFEGSYTVSGDTLVCSITMYGTAYSVTIPAYTSVTDNGDGTFTVTGEYTVVDSTGVMSHPGNAGMQAIANKIMEQLGID